MKILILSNDHLYSNLALKRFIRKNHKNIVGLILPDFLIPGKSFLESVRFLLKKSFFQFIFYKWFEEKIYKFKVAFGLGKLKPLSYYSKKYNFPLMKISSINSKTTTNLINRLKPDVIYSVAYPQKISEIVLSIPQKGCINFHDSILPKYRGLCAYFWITANNEKKGGVTALYIDKELDTGKIIMQQEFKIDKDDSMQRVYYKNSKLMGKMILEIQEKLNNNKIKVYQQLESVSSYYSWPNKDGARLFKKNRKKLFKFKELWESI